MINQIYKQCLNVMLKLTDNIFLLVRLIRSTLVDKRLANAFNLKILMYLIIELQPNLLENAGDSIVELSI